MSKYELAKLVGAMYGLSYCYTLLVCYITPLFLNSFGVSFQNIGFINIATPVTSLVAQQGIGTLSDRLGKRLLFFRLGIIALSLGLLCLPLSQKMFLSPLAPGLVAVWVAGLGLNGALVVLRASVADAVPKHQQAQANGYFSTAAGLGLLSSYLLGSVGVPFAEDLGLSSTEALFLIGSGICVLSAVATDHFLQADDEQLSLEYQDKVFCSHSFMEEVAQYVAFWRMPVWLSPACGAIFWAWIGWFSLLMFLPNWVATSVFGGGDTAQAGLQWASLGMALQAGFCALLGLRTVAWYIKSRGAQQALWGTLCGQTLLHLGFVLPALCIGVWPGIAKLLILVLLTMLGAPWGLIHSIPYVIVGELGDPQRNGKLQGRLNTYIVLAQLLVSLATKPLAAVLPIGQQGIYMMMLGGLCSLFGLIQYSRQPLLKSGSFNELNNIDTEMTPFKSTVTEDGQAILA